MIDLIVNTPNEEHVYEGFRKTFDCALGEVVDNVIDCAQVLHPDWTSMVVTIVNVKTE